MSTKATNPQTKAVLSAAEQIVYALAPFVAAVLLTLTSFINAEFKLDLSFKYVANSVITAVSLLAFYFPFRSIFKTKFLSRDRITKKVFQYSVRASLVYNGHYREFIAFSEIEFKERREKFINRNLQLVDMTYSQFLEQYKFSIAEINKDKNLSKRQKKMLRKIILVTRFIKIQNPDKVLPGTEHGTEFKRVRSSMQRQNTSNTVIKILRAGLTAFAIIGIFFTVDYTQTVMGIITAVALRIFSGIMQILIACYAANRIVNVAYFNELSEKNQYMDDFIEYQGLREEYRAMLQSLKDHKDDDDDSIPEIVVAKVTKEVEVVKEIFVPMEDKSDE